MFRINTAYLMSVAGSMILGAEGVEDRFTDATTHAGGDGMIRVPPNGEKVGQTVQLRLAISQVLVGKLLTPSPRTPAPPLRVRS